MAYTKQTWTDGANGGTPVTAARLNNMETGIAAATVVTDLAVAMLRANAQQTGLAATTWLTMNLQVADVDSHNGFSANKWTVPGGQAGIYAIEGGVTAVFAAPNYLNAGIYKNGVATTSSWGNAIQMGAGGNVGVTTGRKILTLAVGDYITLGGFSGSTWSTLYDVTAGPWLSIERIR